MYVCMYAYVTAVNVNVCMCEMFSILAHHHGWIQGPATVGQLPVHDEEGEKCT